ncbi:MAG: hypothetical protein ABW168_00285 [Sedimenticola sp.]
MSKTYADMTTDELLELLPNNLHVARNDNAASNDRWRIFNSHTKKYVEPGYPTARTLMIGAMVRIDEQHKAWTGG